MCVLGQEIPLLAVPKEKLLYMCTSQQIQDFTLVLLALWSKNKWKRPKLSLTREWKKWESNEWMKYSSTCPQRWISKLYRWMRKANVRWWQTFSYRSKISNHKQYVLLKKKHKVMASWKWRIIVISASWAYILIRRNIV